MANKGYARGLLLGASLCLTLGCGGDPEALSAALPDGGQLQVSAQGQVQLSYGGEVVFATAAGHAPVVSRFEESFTGPFAIWLFEREGEEQLALSRYRGAEQVGDAVEVRYENEDGEVSGVLRVSAGSQPQTAEIELSVTGFSGQSALSVPLACDAQAGFYGFGEQYNGTDQRGEAFTLHVGEQGIGRDPAQPPGGINGDLHTTYFPMPYYLDPRGYGLLVETEHRVEVDLCQRDADAAWFEVVSGEPFKAAVLTGPTTADVIRQLGDRVGRPAAPPAWAYSLWIGAQGGTDELLGKVDMLEQASIPAGVLWVQDWTGPRPNAGGGTGVQYRWVHDDAHYPQLPDLIADFKTRGYRFLGYANPFIDPALDHFDEMEAQGLLIQNEVDATYTHLAPNGNASHPDLTNPETQAYVQGFLRDMVDVYGMDGWMADFGEWLPLDAKLQDGSDPRAYHNRYPVEWHRIWREVMDEVRPDGDYVVFARSGFTGVHAYSQVHWVGDQEADFSPYDGLPTVVPAMLNLGLSGIPFVTHDIAGFSGGPSTKELYMRWIELGAFTPIMRTHEGNLKEQNWSWSSDTETAEQLRRFALVHDALAPELMAWADEASQTSLPIVRHLMLVFPDDEASRAISDQYMLGDSLLVAPVVEQGAVSRSVYLPPGDWYHVWTGQPYEGGATLEVDAPIGQPPVFALGADRTDLRSIQ